MATRSPGAPDVAAASPAALSGDAAASPAALPDDAVHPLTREAWRAWLEAHHERTMLYFAPRRPGSGWSRPNKERVARLEAAGLMAPAGVAKVEAARRDGSWAMLDAIEELEVPDDLAAALARYPDAARRFEAFPRSAMRGILEWIAQAKTEATRRRRVEETARLAGEGVRANQWRR